MEVDTYGGVGAACHGENGRSGTQTGDATHLLPQILDFTQAQSFRDRLMALQGQSTIILDAGAVERMSTPCAQVLLAAGRRSDGSLKIINASDVFRTALADLGLQPEFSKWMV